MKMYVYPTRDRDSGEVWTAQTAPMRPPWHHIRALLLEMHRIKPIRSYDDGFLSIRTPDAPDES